MRIKPFLSRNINRFSQKKSVMDLGPLSHIFYCNNAKIIRGRAPGHWDKHKFDFCCPFFQSSLLSNLHVINIIMIIILIPHNLLHLLRLLPPLTTLMRLFRVIMDLQIIVLLGMSCPIPILPLKGQQEFIFCF